MIRLLVQNLICFCFVALEYIVRSVSVKVDRILPVMVQSEKFNDFLWKFALSLLDDVGARVVFEITIHPDSGLCLVEEPLSLKLAVGDLAIIYIPVVHR